MKNLSKIWVVLAGGSLLLAGCNETVSNQVKVRPPAATPAPVPSFVHEPLPMPARTPSLSALQTGAQPAIDVLVQKVQADFDAGQRDYAAGNLDKAREDFDSAQSAVLSSGLRAESDPRLAKLLDEIAEITEKYERDAEKGAAEEADVAPEPAPIDEIADLSLPAGDPRLARKAERELISVPHDLPLTVNDSVLQYLSFFTTTRGRAIVEHGLDRAGRYNDMIRRVLAQEGVPEDLIYLAQAESAFLPQAVSRAGARGIWQFMPFRGEEYDLNRSYWVDERSDPEKATRAAARHMRDLYDMFGDWYLVMAAYNSGPGNVIKAIERTGYADFWELQRHHALPKQTQNYVPIIVALALVAKDPALYGVAVHPEKPETAAKVQLGHAIDLHLVSDATGTDVEDLRLLNPSLLRSATPSDPHFELALPAGTAEKLKDNIQHVPEDKWTSWRLHTVEQGESLSDVARHYRVTVASIEAANHLEGRSALPAGFLLNVPTPPPVVKLVRYRVHTGDTLEGIADRFDVTVAELKRWNGIRGSKAPRGARLRIYAGGQPAEPTHAKTKPEGEAPAAVQNVAASGSDSKRYHVKPGETLYSIAHAHKTTVEALRESNSFLLERPLKAGDTLVIQR